MFRVDISNISQHEEAMIVILIHLLFCTLLTQQEGHFLNCPSISQIHVYQPTLIVRKI